MRDKLTRRNVLKGIGTGAAVGTAGCTSVLPGGGQSAVAIGGKQFTEQLILSNMSKLLLKDAGIAVDEKFPVGGNTANHKAITSGNTDHYWEYTGTGWYFHLPGEHKRIRDPQKLYQKVDKAYQDQYDIDWLKMAQFNNTYVVTANPAWQEKTGVKTLSGLAEYINNGGKVKWAVSQEYLNNPTAFGRLPEFYGFQKNIENVTWEKMAIGTIIYKVVANGQTDLGVGFTTNPNVEKFNLTTIEDDKNWFVIYYPAPLVRKEALTDEVRTALNKPTSKLDTKTIRNLNAKVSIQKKDPEAVAENWLKKVGLL